MNIEERSFGGALRLAGDRLFHLQVCGNDRGAPGGDLTPWDEVFSTLREIGYQGILGIESFSADNATIARAASIWRPLARTQDDLALDGLAFLRAATR
jgi:D-psicose/D-tagatose/L-ribulose 3-epimerase